MSKLANHRHVDAVEAHICQNLVVPELYRLCWLFCLRFCAGLGPAMASYGNPNLTFGYMRLYGYVQRYSESTQNTGQPRANSTLRCVVC